MQSRFQRKRFQSPAYPPDIPSKSNKAQVEIETDQTPQTQPAGAKTVNAAREPNSQAQAVEILARTSKPVEKPSTPAPASEEVSKPANANLKPITLIPPATKVTKAKSQTPQESSPQAQTVENIANTTKSLAKLSIPSSASEDVSKRTTAALKPNTSTPRATKVIEAQKKTPSSQAQAEENIAKTAEPREKSNVPALATADVSKSANATLQPSTLASFAIEEAESEAQTAKKPRISTPAEASSETAVETQSSSVREAKPSTTVSTKAHIDVPNSNMAKEDQGQGMRAANDSRVVEPVTPERTKVAEQSEEVRGDVVGRGSEVMQSPGPLTSPEGNSQSKAAAKRAAKKHRQRQIAAEKEAKAREMEEVFEEARVRNQKQKEKDDKRREEEAKKEEAERQEMLEREQERINALPPVKRVIERERAKIRLELAEKQKENSAKTATMEGGVVGADDLVEAVERQKRSKNRHTNESTAQQKMGAAVAAFRQQEIAIDEAEMVEMASELLARIKMQQGRMGEAVQQYIMQELLTNDEREVVIGVINEQAEAEADRAVVVRGDSSAADGESPCFVFVEV